MTFSENYVPAGLLIDFGDTLAYIDEIGNKEYHEALFLTAKESHYEGGFSKFRVVFDDILCNSMKGEFKNLKEFWERLIKRLDLQKSSILIESLEEVRSCYSSAIFKLYEGADSVLAILKSRFKLALVSNCAIGTSDVIETLGLNSYFECIILSYEVGVRKPHRQMYLDALRCLRLEPYECIFIADEISDLEGARQLGMKTFLVTQGKHTFLGAENPNFKPEFQCKSISELVKILGA